MVTVIITGLVAVFFAYFGQFKEYEKGLKIAFLPIFLFLSLRYDYGNDYHAYYEQFQLLQSYGLERFQLYNKMEIGWVYLNYIFSPLGFFAMVAFLSYFNCVVYYKIIKEFVPKKYYWLAVFLYVFNPYIMLVHLSAMRQSLAILIFLLALKFFLKKRIVHFALVIIFASFFHKSVLLILPLIFLLLSKWKINLKASIIVVIIFVSLFFLGSLISGYVNLFLTTYLVKYAHHTENDVEVILGSGLVILSMLIALLVTLYYTEIQDEKLKYIFKIYIISFFIIPISLYVFLVSRTGFYLSVFSILVYPNIVDSVKNNLSKKIILFFFIAITGYNFYVFFKSPIWQEDYGTYQTILSRLNFLDN